jgi:TetR/AcrR family transcriptional regulator, transcriptional repressor of aconitase
VPRVSDEHLAARRRQIMDAAINCFSREGFHRTTMQDIVAESGLSAGSLYRYFDSKESIVAAIAGEHHVPEGTALAEARDAPNAIDGLRQIVRASLGRLSDPAEQRWRRVTIQLWSEALRDERVMDVVREGLDGPIDELAHLLRRGQRDGRLPAGLDPDATARVCASIFQGLVLQQAWDPAIGVESYVNATLALVDALEGPSGTRS